MFLLSIYPSEGLSSLAFLPFLASLRGTIGPSYSHELEINLTAIACYNTREASQAFPKMLSQG
ncbi:hypothetical protein ACHAWX_000900 [Stephanocyclus meneghinianus]